MHTRFVLIAVLTFAGLARAEPTTAPATTQPAPKDTGGLVVTHHQINSIGYSATTGRLAMKDEAGKAKANVFFVAYEKDRTSDDELNTRPIMYLFNGGPGAAAVWLHLGTVGPMRIAFDDHNEPLGPPFKLIENPQTWLAFADLVFIDPVGTGYSRPAEGEDPKQFFGVQNDLQSVSEFIRLYTTKYKRWASPKFLAGESYGTTRAAALSEMLLERQGIALNGVILVSSVLDFQTLRSRPGNDLPYVVYLPSYAATSQYHKKLAADLQSMDTAKLVAEVEAWSRKVYLPALSQGAALAAAERNDIIKQLARYTGLSENFVEKNDLRIDPSQYEKSLLADQRLILGRFDSTVTGFDNNPLANDPSYDPSLSRYLPAYSSTFNDYVRRQLNFENDLPYEVLSGSVQPWGGFEQPGGGYLFVADNLQSALIKNPKLKVLFASGYYDLATPFAAADYTIDQLRLSPELRANVSHTFYAGGHMMYHHASEHEKLSKDVGEFVMNAMTPAK